MEKVIWCAFSPRYIRSKEMSVISYLISDLKTMKPERINNISVGCRHTFNLHTGPTIPIPSSPPPPPTHDSYPWHHKNSIQKFFKSLQEIIKSWSLFTRDTILLSSYLPLNFWRVQISANAQLPLMHQCISELYVLYLEKRRIIFFFDLNLQISFENFGLYYVQSC